MAQTRVGQPFAPTDVVWKGGVVRSLPYRDQRREYAKRSPIRRTTANSLSLAKRHLAQMPQVTVSTFRRFWVGRRVCDSPKAEFDGKTKTTDWSKLPHFPAPTSNGKGEGKWVNPDTFFDELPAVMKQVSPLPGEEPLYADREPA